MIGLQGLGSRVQGSGFRFFGFRVEDYRVQGLGLGFGIQ